MKNHDLRIPGPAIDTQAATDRIHSPNPFVFQINAVTWLGRLRASGVSANTLAEIPEPEFDRLAARGVDFVWLMGAWTKGTMGLELARANPAAQTEYTKALPGWQASDVVGSPFAIRSYEISRELGGAAALANVRDRLARRGIGLLLDFVPNHTARDCEWVFEHPDYYVSGNPQLAETQPARYFRADTRLGPRAIAFGKDPHFEGWIDTAQLNWWNPELREAMTRVLGSIAGVADGVRCDMAMLLLNSVFAGTWPELTERGVDRPRWEAWPVLLDAARAVNPRFLFLAEVYWSLEGRLLELGFDFTYDKQLYDHLREGNSARIRASYGQPEVYLRRSMHFIENHDETPAVSAFPRVRLGCAAILAATLPGMRFVHEGQLDGRTVRLPVQLGRPARTLLLPELATFYDRLFEILREPAVRVGEFIRLAVSPAPADGGHASENVLAYAWAARGASLVIVLVNVQEAPASARVGLNLLPIGGREIELVDALTLDRHVVSGDELLTHGLTLLLPGWGSRIFRLLHGG
jgi:hypothetical protein